MKSVLEQQNNLTIRQSEVVKILTKSGRVAGVKTSIGEGFKSKSVVITVGTFLDGLIHIGLVSFPGGRLGESASVSLTECIRGLGFNILRFKTGTCPRINSKTINYGACAKQDYDAEPVPFSFKSDVRGLKQLPCYTTYTNKKTHEIIRSGLDRSPLYSGKIKASGVRYCPSIEDKIVKFADKDRHQIFLEPEGRDTVEVYPNGFSTSLPIDIQIKMLRSVEGLENAEIIRPGYGIEHCVVEPTQLKPSLETKLVKGLFLAGQINGTTGYEEAAAQGLMAGINAALFAKDESPFVLDRSTSYIGVLIDDLVTKGTNEPYRMFTSRVEYRLIIREDNADLRLGEFGYKLGLVSKEDYNRLRDKKMSIEAELERLKKTRMKSKHEINESLKQMGTVPIDESVTLEELLKRPQIDYSKLDLMGLGNAKISQEAKKQVELIVKYEGYFKRELEYIKKFKDLESIKIPESFSYKEIPGLSREIKEKLSKIMPQNLGQASRVSGVTPSAVSVLMVYLKKFKGC